LTAVVKSRARQRSRIIWLRKGDANTRFFHIRANARKKRNFIHSLTTDSGFASTQEEKHVVIYNHFLNHIGTYSPRSCALNFSNISKILANRLVPKLEHLVSYNHTTFIKKRCIHDCFLYVQEVIQSLHKRRTPALFIKLDISKAFDIVSWPYLLSILQHLGFGQAWRN
jgi:hypothetical protein